MRRTLVVGGSTIVFMLALVGIGNAQPNVDCDPFSIACGYTIPVQIGPFDIDVPIESVFPPQPE